MKFYLGGGLASHRPGVAGIRLYEFAIGAVGLALIMATPSVSPWLSVGILAVCVLLIAGLRVRRSFQDATGSTRGPKPHPWWLRPLSHHVEGGRPVLLQHVELLGYSRGDQSTLEVGFIHHETRRTVEVTGILRLQGTTVGGATPHEEQAFATGFVSLLNRLASTGIPVTGVDLITKAHPPRWTRSPTGRTEAELRELVGTVSSEYDHLLSVTINTQEAPEWAQIQDDDPDASLAGPFRVLDEVARMCASHGLRPIGVVSADELTPTLAALMAPIEPVSTGWAAIPSFAPDTIGLRVGDDWLTSVGMIPSDGWPAETVDAHWLHPLLTHPTDTAPYRTIVISHRFVPYRPAIAKARAESAYAAADVVGAHEKGIITTGEEQNRLNAGSWALADMINGAAGNTPVVRVIVHAHNIRGLTAARHGIEDIVTSNLGCRGFQWCDTDQARSLMACLPTGSGVRKAK